MQMRQKAGRKEERVLADADDKDTTIAVATIKSKSCLNVEIVCLFVFYVVFLCLCLRDNLQSHTRLMESDRLCANSLGLNCRLAIL